MTLILYYKLFEISNTCLNAYIANYCC